MATRLAGVLFVVFALFLPFSAVTASTSVTSSLLDHIVIIPNDRPTLIDMGTDQQFVATGYTKDGRVLSGLTFIWTTDGKHGRITSDGMFTPDASGVGRITATNGKIAASVGVRVHGTVVVKEPAATVPPSNTTVQQVTPEKEPTEQPKTTEKIAATQTPVSQTSQKTIACTTVRAWIWIVILLVLFVGLFAYFLSLGESRTLLWWVVPLLATAAPIALYFIIRCGTLHAWFPWTDGVLGILVSFFYMKVLRPTERIQTGRHA